jgi:hypothetical protein
MTWIFVDDSPDDAAAFADDLRLEPNALDVEVLLPSAAKERLFGQNFVPDGVLMDVDLSYAPGERGSGPGIAQDIRVKQKAHDISEYPVVRFSYREQIKRNVQGDPASDDLFDLKIQKEEVTTGRDSVKRRLRGIRNIYAQLIAQTPPKPEALTELLKLDNAELAGWSHQAFHDRLLSALQVATHVGASAFMRSFILTTGLLISEEVLSFRLGVDAAASGQAWVDVREGLPFRYSGLASESFDRWWSRGLEDWWFQTVKDECPLVSLSITRRLELLSAKAGITGLVPLQMPRGSAGDKPWRLCALTLEDDPPHLIPVDPAESVRLTPRDDLAPWVDPLYAALGPALQAKGDFRLNRQDLERLRRKHS